jgi:murein L,D-transpeptidase YafK
MKTVIFVLTALATLTLQQTDFKLEQLKYSRVRTAYTEKESILKKQYQDLKQDLYNQQVLIRIFKQEKQVEIWSKNSISKSFIHIKTWDICTASGNLGPKRRQGDNQVPEGVYYIDRFNPNSNFYLSLGINYPNASDRILSDKTSPGGDIFMHGACVSIGCVALTDDIIKELYLICIEARQHGQHHIPVHIFPFKMTDYNVKAFSRTFPEHINFWNNLQSIFTYWEENHNLPEVRVTTKGNYLIQ